MIISARNAARRLSSNRRWLFSTASAFSDLRNPENLYPRARLRRRKFVYHGGPTNSGKTHWALEALKNADPEKGGGVYAGPLRLLAVEVYERLNLNGVYTSLFTGQERREVPFSTHASCTIEMVPIASSFDVAVVDEIQLIGTLDRGHAWTRAVLGLDAREIHVCGAPEAADLVERMCRATGDDFEFREYSRLTPLSVEDKPLKSLAEVEKGDCVVTFSRNDIHKVRREIETLTDKKCCVVYGQLPPETRSEQARMFNNGEYDVLVASDAIGMGLNLNIGRIIFRSTQKFSSPTIPPTNMSKFPEALKVEKKLAPVEPALVKQIAGRAGRASSEFGGVGKVTAMNQSDLEYVRSALKKTLPNLTRAGIFPPTELLELYAEERESEGLDKLNFSDLALDYVGKCEVDPETYFLCPHHDMAAVAQKLENVANLPLAEKLTFCNAPCNINDKLAVPMLERYASWQAGGRGGGPPSVRLPTRPPKKLFELHDLCSKHNVLDLYLWLSFRFPNTFLDADLARAQKFRCIRLIHQALAENTLDLPTALSDSKVDVRHRPLRRHEIPRAKILVRGAAKDTGSKGIHRSSSASATTKSTAKPAVILRRLRAKIKSTKANPQNGEAGDPPKKKLISTVKKRKAASTYSNT